MAEAKTLDLSRNHLLYGDCLDMLGRVPDGSVDLVYLDPPFKSDTDYNMLFGSETGDDTAQVKAFADTWYWHAGHEDVYLSLTSRQGAVGSVVEAMRMMLGPCGMLAYVLFMTERLIELHRVLKPTGSLYLHCDPTASHYLKLVLGAVFGPKFFQNEVVWKRSSAHSDSKKMGSIHDVIFYVSKSGKRTFNKIYQAYDQSYTDNFYNNKDKSGRLYRKSDLTAAGLSGGGYTYEWKGITKIWRCPIETMQEYEKQGRIYYSKNGIPNYIRYLDEMPGVPLQDVWTDIPPIGSQAKERLGYPTQKPLALLERIIIASSHEGDIVLDPFCGCGTAFDAAQALGRRWIGMDVSALAINVIRARLEDVHGANVMTDVGVTGIPTDVTAARMLFNKDPFDFEKWAVGIIRARPNDKQTGGAGSDGTLSFFAREKARSQRGIVSVKGGANIGPAMVRDLRGTVEAMQAAMGVLILMGKPTRGMVAEAAKAGLWHDEFTGGHYPKLQIITVEDLLDGRPPNMPTPRNPYTKATHTHTDTRQGELL